MLRLMKHQSQAVRLMQDRSHFAFFWSCGTGKTLAMLAGIAEHGARTLVICPKSIMETAWLADAAAWFPQLTVTVAWSSDPAKRRQLIAQPSDVTVTNFDTFKRNIGRFKQAGFDRLIIDESSAIKNPRTQLSRAATEFAATMKSVYLLSGTPAPNSDIEYYSQVATISDIFGRSYWRFCTRYFSPIKIKVQGRDVVKGWRPIKERRQDFLTKLGSVSRSLDKRDVMDLPEQTDIVRMVELSSDEMRNYAGMRDELVALVESGVIVSSRDSRMMKLRQMASGFLYHDDGTYTVGNAKLRELSATLDEIGANKVVIWAEFRAEIDAIREMIEERGDVVDVIDGRTREVAEVVESFQRGNTQYLICHPQSAGHGVTLTAASYAVYYSLAYSHEYHEQSRDRIHRHGQRNACTYIYLLSRGTCDPAIHNALKKKKKASSAVLDSLRKAVTV